MLHTDPQDKDKDPFASALKAYIERTLHVPINLTRWAGGSDLPVFLTHAYTLYHLEIENTRLIVMGSKQASSATPSDISKHIHMIEAAFKGPAIYAARAISSTVRARLIKAGTAFIAPGNQLYIPMLAMDLRERFIRPKATRPEKLSPSAQTVLFWHLRFGEAFDALTPSALAAPLRYSPMSIGRAFDELDALDLANTERLGREKHLRFNARAEVLIEMAKTFLVSPVSKRFPVRLRGALSDIPFSGLTALSKLTDINSDEPETFAVTLDAWRALLNRHVVKTVSEVYEADAIFETWRYDPRALSDEDIVDPLSLYAQFWDHDDARISMAADDLLRVSSW